MTGIETSDKCDDHNVCMCSICVFGYEMPSIEEEDESNLELISCFFQLDVTAKFSFVVPVPNHIYYITIVFSLRFRSCQSF